MKIKKEDYQILVNHWKANHKWNGESLQKDYLSEYSTIKAINAKFPKIKLQEAFELLEKIKAEQ